MLYPEGCSITEILLTAPLLSQMLLPRAPDQLSVRQLEHDVRKKSPYYYYYYYYCVYSSPSCSRSEYAGYPFSIMELLIGGETMGMNSLVARSHAPPRTHLIYRQQQVDEQCSRKLRELDDMTVLENEIVLPYPRQQMPRFSPMTTLPRGGLPEILQVLHRVEPYLRQPHVVHVRAHQSYYRRRTIYDVLLVHPTDYQARSHCESRRR
jgi:hypothetical protein